jgi:type IX secretion system PorP/SprF family membrane protein
MKKRISIAVLFIHLCGLALAQQVPYYTQTNTNYFLLNPAVTGTKKLVDARICYRNQWTGFEGAPVTQTIALHSRLLKGLMGVGGFMVKDETGPIKLYNFGLNYAFHIHFPDVELSIGLSGNMMKYMLDGSKITTHNSGDHAIDRSVEGSDWIPNMQGGLYLYNDRFHCGLSMHNLLESTAEFYREDTIKNGKIATAPHIYLSLGYNFSTDPDYVWEHTVLAGYVAGTPLTMDYNLRVHIKEKLFIGTALRLKDAIALQAGVTIRKTFQVGYSYDIVTSKLRPYQSGTHEVTLTFRSDIFDNNHHGRLSDFVRQKYDLF